MLGIHLFRFDLFIFFAAAALSLILTRWLIGFSHRCGFLDHPSEIKTHSVPTPSLGGVGLFLTFWVVVWAGIAVAHFLKHRAGGWADEFAAGAVFLTPKIFGIFIGSLIISGVGLLDDKFRLTPPQKLAGQALAALVLMSLGLNINLFWGLGVIGDVITFIWILLIINAFNFIDSLDGHCAGVAFISALFFFAITQIIHQALVGLFLLAFAGALLGFLRYNFCPAKIFLGDNGSLFIGYLMAAITLLCRYQAPHFLSVTVFIPVLIFGVPIYDTVSVVLARLSRGVAPWKGDRNHFAHRLVKIGMGTRTAVIFSYFVAFTIGTVAVLTTQVNPFGEVLLGVLFFSIMSIIAFLEIYISRRLRHFEELAVQKKDAHV